MLVYVIMVGYGIFFHLYLDEFKERFKRKMRYAAKEMIDISKGRNHTYRNDIPIHSNLAVIRDYKSNKNVNDYVLRSLLGEKKLTKHLEKQRQREISQGIQEEDEKGQESGSSFSTDKVEHVIDTPEDTPHIQYDEIYDIQDNGIHTSTATELNEKQKILLQRAREATRRDSSSSEDEMVTTTAFVSVNDQNDENENERE